MILHSLYEGNRNEGDIVKADKSAMCAINRHLRIGSSA